ncbi:hypothetical protein B2J88_22160 [Rhodococcus sp. SRB_17]|uniref:hypothetical protein n=1 Tax=Acidovorax sp. SRB_24 TaxID=1962700 RepID=UPI00145DAF39|nr:hypothetical protein [Acidovorax sp. SRB_24]NMM79137.1 hypothetical protein [Acidovorax sp. SRB_24]NMM87035.1 hypothetical protein [Rhodococcus sp. SRB_17]
MPLPKPPVRRARNKEDNELLIKGMTCALIGAVVLLAPYLAKSASVQDLMRQAYLVGWFALILGCAFLGRYALRRLAAHRSAPRG